MADPAGQLSPRGSADASQIASLGATAATAAESDVDGIDVSAREGRCPHCGAEFKNNFRLRRHMVTHNGMVRCTRIPGVETTREGAAGCEFRCRVEPLHPTQRKYKCPYVACAKSFARQDHLRRHMRTHDESQRFHCPDPACGKSFLERTRLRFHMRRIHGVELPPTVRKGPRRKFAPDRDVFACLRGSHRRGAASAATAFRARGQLCIRERGSETAEEPRSPGSASASSVHDVTNALALPVCPAAPPVAIGAALAGASAFAAPGEGMHAPLAAHPAAAMAADTGAGAPFYWPAYDPHNPMASAQSYYFQMQAFILQARIAGRQWGAVAAAAMSRRGSHIDTRAHAGGGPAQPFEPAHVWGASACSRGLQSGDAAGAAGTFDAGWMRSSSLSLRERVLGLGGPEPSGSGSSGAPEAERDAAAAAEPLLIAASAAEAGSPHAPSHGTDTSQPPPAQAPPRVGAPESEVGDAASGWWAGGAPATAAAMGTGRSYGSFPGFSYAPFASNAMPWYPPMWGSGVHLGPLLPTHPTASAADSTGARAAPSGVDTAGGAAAATHLSASAPPPFQGGDGAPDHVGAGNRLQGTGAEV